MTLHVPELCNPQGEELCFTQITGIRQERGDILLGGARFHPASFILYAYLKDAFISSYFALFLVVFGPKV